MTGVVLSLAGMLFSGLAVPAAAPMSRIGVAVGRSAPQGAAAGTPSPEKTTPARLSTAPIM